MLSQIIRDLRAATDYEIIDVLNGEEALVAVAQQRPDLTLTPIMDGCEATRRINAVPHAAIHSDYRGQFLCTERKGRRCGRRLR
jgi:CheY-like chemotaxis protein